MKRIVIFFTWAAEVDERQDIREIGAKSVQNMGIENQDLTTLVMRVCELYQVKAGGWKETILPAWRALKDSSGQVDMMMDARTGRLENQLKHACVDGVLAVAVLEMLGIPGDTVISHDRNVEWVKGAFLHMTDMAL